MPCVPQLADLSPRESVQASKRRRAGSLERRTLLVPKVPLETTRSLSLSLSLSLPLAVVLAPSQARSLARSLFPGEAFLGIRRVRARGDLRRRSEGFSRNLTRVMSGVLKYSSPQET